MSRILSFFDDLKKVAIACGYATKPTASKVSKTVILKERSQDCKWIHAIFQYNRNVMITTLKKHIQDCTDTMNKYSTHLALMQPLPESPILQQLQDKWEEKGKVCQTECNKAIQKLSEVYQKYEENSTVQIPKDLTVQTGELKSKCETLLLQAVHLASDISERIEDWEFFKHKRDKFSNWLVCTQEKLKEITSFHLFLTDFQPVLDHYKVIEIEVIANDKDFQYLVSDNQKHLFSPNIAEKEYDKILQPDRAKFSMITERWMEFKKTVSTFSTIVEAWKKMIDLYHDLERWKDELILEIIDVEKREKELKKLGRSVEPTTQKYKHLLNEVIGKQSLLEQLYKSIDWWYLSQDEHGVVIDFVRRCRKLGDELDQIKLQLEGKVYVIDTTASEQLQKQLQSTVKQCFRFCLLLFCPIFLVIIVLLIAVYGLDCPARYQLFHKYEHLSFLQFTTVADNQNNSSLKLVF